MAWTDKMVEDLKVMWKQGLTTGEIGRRLGVSKNSIVGKVHRLQLDARPSPIKRKTDPENQTGDLFKQPIKKEKIVIEKKTVSPIKPEPKVEKTIPQPTKEKTTAPKTKEEKDIEISSKFFLKQPTVSKDFNGNAMLIDLDNHTCRWPLGDPKDDNFRFCGRKVRIGQTYCEEHSALAYVKPNKK
ncbi:MAG: hypothetical protein J6Y53_01915 [Alphaproteobacteria bacterium]|nr:hypothetical protein [Alphaproteobacteria bacterium]